MARQTYLPNKRFQLRGFWQKCSISKDPPLQMTRRKGVKFANTSGPCIVQSFLMAR